MRLYITILAIFLVSFSSIQAQPSSDKLIKQGVLMHDRGHYKEAINYYQQALKLNPTSMSATYEMALSYLQLRDYDKAMKYSTKIINANFKPLLVDAYCVKSTALADQNKLSQAVKLLNEALDRCGDEYLLHYNLGLSYFKAKNLTLSIYHLQKAIEIDTTHASAFLLYAYALSDSDRWVQSFLSFQFFLLLEPNTNRSKDAFGEMYDIISQKLSPNSPRLTYEDGVNRKIIYEQLDKIRPKVGDPNLQYAFFEQASKNIFFTLSQMREENRKGLLWDFFVPIYDEVLESGHFETYCRYISSSYFPQSLKWWKTNTNEVDAFISWFENGDDTPDASFDNEYGDDSDI